MTNHRIAEKLYEWKPMYKRAAGRPRTRWENYVKEDLRIMTINNWTKGILDRVK
jgi:hypothetical protein